MRLREYFLEKRGIGVLATADAAGKVDTAIYSTPHVDDDGTVVFIMRDRLTHQNLLANSHASYLFMEAGERFRGIRLFLEKIREDTDPERIAAMTRRHLSPEEDKAKGPKFLVYFTVSTILPLIGSGAPGISL